ncbi:hypothetical protein PoB_002096900 [Plakobranchus ocellatus]|uniref:Uncharacterized protein n=1 Tax=Plakobranchus ocellatus TaxID=259542 RepID=A0AAV3ZKS1_9GAST|nr:hypothetical protein PoB_002096900 [Plakobranchus ocellatus]
MVYTRKSRRTRRDEEAGVEEGQEAGAAAKEMTSPPVSEEYSYRRRRRYANNNDDEAGQTEAVEESGESGSRDRVSPACYTGTDKESRRVAPGQDSRRENDDSMSYYCLNDLILGMA